MEKTHFDVLIVGAGLSGVGAAYHLQKNCPSKSYAILEGRERLGGTWDLFRYPGIRSDSDMYTLGYSFRPWTNPKAIADGEAILAYIRDTAEMYGIDRHIRFGNRVQRLQWSSEQAKWSVEVLNVATGHVRELTCNFVFACAGYYSYESGYSPEFPGSEQFAGRIVHPQNWTPDVDYAGKRVIVIGSGATAVTLVPVLAKRAAHVTMLQRSPSYVVTTPERDRISDWLRERLPESSAYAITRWKNVLLSMGFYTFSRRYPARAKKLLISLVRKQLGSAIDVEKHFTPSYNPWDQRICVVPDGDLFKAIDEGGASVVTGHVDRFYENGIRLTSGQELPADLIVTATGLNLQFLGGIKLEVDGALVEPAKTMTYKGMMLSDVPNLAYAIGYTNASWTLKCDLTCEYVCRLLKHMDARGYAMSVPRRTDPLLKEESLLDFTSTYVLRSIAEFPRQGNVSPWKLYQNYALDMMTLRRASLEDGSMQFSSPTPKRAGASPSVYEPQ